MDVVGVLFCCSFLNGVAVQFTYIGGVCDVQSSTFRVTRRAIVAVGKVSSRLAFLGVWSCKVPGSST